jgi:hypothetical protein
MRVAAVSLLAVTVVAVACKTGQRTATPSTSPTPSTTQAPAPANGTGVAAAPGAGGARPPGGARPRPSPAAMDSMRRGMVARMLTEIAGRENEPAGQVYKNVKMWKDVPARAFLDTMNSYGRALGLTCTGCHIGGQWASDDRQNKKLAREMQAMVNDLNEKTFAKMNNVDADYRRVTCAMCHRGSGHPAQTVSLDAPAPGGPPPGQRPPNE